MRIPQTQPWMLLLPVLFTCVRAPAAVNDTAAVEPFVGPHTWVVARADVSRLDLDAARHWADQVAQRPDMKGYGTHLTDDVNTWTQWVDAFRHAGGTTVWAVVRLDALQPRVLLIVPMGAGADPAALTAWFTQHTGMAVERQKDLLVVAPARDALRNARAGASEWNARWADALNSTGDAPLRIAITPPADDRRVIESMMPTLPGGQSPALLTQGILWASAQLHAPPAPGGTILLETSGPDTGKAITAMLHTLSASVQHLPPSDAHSTGALLTRRLADAAQAEGNRVVIRLDTSSLDDIASLLIPARQRSLIVESMSNIRQILLYAVMDADTHKDKHFPVSLEQLVRSSKMPASDLINPRMPEMRPGFIYIQPPAGLTAPGDRLVVYENFRDFGRGVSVGYADGHVEFVTDRARFDRELREARQAATQPAEK